MAGLDERDRARIAEDVRRWYLDAGIRQRVRVVFVASPDALRWHTHREARFALMSFGGRLRARTVRLLAVSAEAAFVTGVCFLVWLFISRGGFTTQDGGPDDFGTLGQPFFDLIFSRHRWSVVLASLGLVFSSVLVAVWRSDELWDLDDVNPGAAVPQDDLIVYYRVFSRHDAGRMVAGAPEPAFASFTFRGLALVVEPPLVMRTETVPSGGDRPHCEDGPALVWPGGEEYFFLHGTRVPPELARGEWDADRIGREQNSELRRLAIERIGWEAYVAGAGFEPVGEAPDPGNPGAVLRLFDVPDSDVRVLVMRNGSPDRSGASRHYAEPVPRTFDDPVEAAAWQYGCPVEVYRQLARRT